MPKDDTILFVRDVPEHLKTEFKAQCALEGVSMKDAIIKLMKQFLKRAKEGKED